MKTTWKRKLSFISMLLVPLVIGATALVWWFQPMRPSIKSDLFLQPAPPPKNTWHVLIPNLKEAKVYVMDRPHAPEELMSDEALSKHKRVRQFTISTNEQGMREGVIGRKQGKRILCVGESVTFGWGVAAEDSYPAHLERLLDVEVINAGIPSSTVEHSSYWIQNYAEALQPDLILLTARVDWRHPNALPNFSNSIQNAARYIAPVPIALVLPPISSFDRRGLSTLEQERQHIQRSLRNTPVLDLTPIFQQQTDEKGVRLRIVEQTQQLLDVKTGAVLVEGVNRPLQSGQPALAPEIVEAFEEHLSWHEPMIFDGGHPDEDGFLLFAQTVANWIGEKGWLDQSKPLK